MAVGDEFLAFVQAGLLVRPVNVLPSPVGKVNELRLLHFGDPRTLEIKACVVLGNHGIMRSCVPQLGGGTDPAGNDGIGIYQPLIAGLDLGMRKPGEHGQAGSQRGTLENAGAVNSPAN